jgi:PilZ domain-containing protein
VLAMSSSEILPPPVEDQRRAPRKKVYFRGKIVYGSDGEYSLDCMINDLSATGAKITLNKSEFIPQHFFLIDFQNDVAHESVVMWIKVRETVTKFGLSFTHSHHFTHLTNPKLQFLKKLALKDRRAHRR